MRFSLIVATVGRLDELKLLFASLEQQTYKDFEVIIIDQNEDMRLNWVEETGAYSFPRTRSRSSVRRVSHARNLGLQAAVGEIVAFPDDDCIYPPELLARVDQAFREEPRFGVRTGPAASPEGGYGSARWQTEPGEIGLANIWICAIAFNIFMLRSVITAIGGFDEQLGPGARFGAGEENDLLLRALQTGCRGWYDTGQLAVHPEKKLTAFGVERAFTYGAGMGYVLRKHKMPARIWLNYMIRPFGGCLLNLARGRLLYANYYWRTLRGRMYGFGAYPVASGALAANNSGD